MVGVRCVAAAVAVVALTAAAATVAAAQQDAYLDVVGGVHKPAIDALGVRGVFGGTLCDDDMFCLLAPLYVFPEPGIEHYLRALPARKTELTSESTVVV